MNTIYSIFLTAALSLSISGCSVINVLKLRSANDDITPAWQSQDSQFPIKTDYIGEKTFIYGSINGVKGFKFMIDTGASFTVLFDTPKIQSLDLPKGYELKIGGWGDEDASLSHQTTMQTLRFGNLSVSDFQGAYIQASKTPYFARSEELIYDGVIGHDLLRHFVWTFDKSANQVTVSNKAFTASKGSYAIPFDVFMSKPSVEAEVDFGNGHIAKSDIIIDTGSRHYLKLSAQYPIGNDILLPEAKITSADFGLSGKAEHKRVTLPALRLGNLTLKNVKTNLIENVDEDDFWVIGNGIFNQFVTTIDYHQETMYLTPYENHQFTTRYNLLGLEVRKLLSGNFLVRYVMPDLPSEHMGIEVGDVITHVNSVASNLITKDDWLNYSATPATYQLCRLKKACVDIATSHIKGYSTQ